ncbi:MAG: histidine phosphatase family protein [Schwartzia sp.]|nr:histidine phosphatase family protein [Schwartzia sp. (in: firmicutes)]
MVRLILVRHGKTEWNALGKYQGQSDIELSEEGMMQAEKLAAHFPVSRLDAIYASDLRRAYMTAERVGERMNVEPQKEPSFRELDFGEWEGCTYKEIIERWPEEGEKFFGAPEKLAIPNGETFQMLQNRAMTRLNEIVTMSEVERHGTIAVFAHGAIIKTMLCTLMHIPLHYVWMLQQSNTAVNIINFDAGYVGIEQLNNTEHLRI